MSLRVGSRFGSLLKSFLRPSSRDNSRPASARVGKLNGQTKKLKELEGIVTPLEVAAMLKQPKYRNLPFKVAPLLRKQAPTRYIRHPISQTVNFYSAKCGAPDLLVAFCGSRHRLMMPIS